MNLTFKKFLIGLVAFFGLILVCQIFQNNCQGKIIPLKIDFLDVGQGDATLISYLGQYQILIDGGPNGEKLLSSLQEKIPWGDKNIEMVILTHPDQDHLKGLIDIMDYYSIGIFLDNGQKAQTEIFKALEEKLKNSSVKTQTIGEGSKINIGKYLNFSFLNPDELIEEDKDRNDQSIVFRMDYGENSFLFTGDAEELSELDMIDDEENIDVDFLKVGHHGSKNSTSEKFLAGASPEYGIISVGKNNRYHHPTEEALERLKNADAKILRTDELGTVELICQNPKGKCEVLE